ncbi:hypothetical protein ASG12_10705 [Williamsia sp. Leaf354]|uniref:hypothetical protein n=1 Tax=Williamsia sp. Leaf354 TaxID=1736349 RepID=UPI0007013E22|nr:hypothetical protein [Williamsia sp. Leaf354]KQR98822.1 hypothetical protein ASG12_10705 [Williamsia sp. Leaf354]
MTVARPTLAPRSVVSRRGLLRNTAAVSTGVVLGAGVLAACGDSAEMTEDMRIAQQLEPLSVAASVDAAAATALAARAPDRAAALAVIAAERQTHATLINDEIARLSPDLARPSSTSGVVADPSPVTTTGGADAAPTSAAPSVRDAAAAVTTVDDLRARLSDARSAAAGLAIAGQGYRAGMLGSVAAALTAEIEVQLS